MRWGRGAAARPAHRTYKTHKTYSACWADVPRATKSPRRSPSLGPRGNSNRSGFIVTIRVLMAPSKSPTCLGAPCKRAKQLFPRGVPQKGTPLEIVSPAIFAMHHQSGVAVFARSILRE